MSADTQTRRRLCAHADEHGDGAHWVEAGEQCGHAARPAPEVEYQCGEQVAVTITGTVAACDEDGLAITRRAAVVLADVGDTVRRLTPAEGEPKPGDVWRDRTGKEWFARDGGAVCAASSYSTHWTVANEEWGPLTLVYRPETPAEVPW